MTLDGQLFDAVITEIKKVEMNLIAVGGCHRLQKNNGKKITGCYKE